MKAIPLILFVSFLLAPKQLLAADYLEALQSALKKASSNGALEGIFNAGNRKGIEALSQLPTATDLKEAIRSSQDGHLVHSALKEMGKAAADPKARVSIDGPIHRTKGETKGIGGIALESNRYSRTIHWRKTARLRIWVNGANRPALFLQSHPGSKPVVVPLRRGRP